MYGSGLQRLFLRTIWYVLTPWRLLADGTLKVFALTSAILRIEHSLDSIIAIVSEVRPHNEEWKETLGKRPTLVTSLLSKKTETTGRFTLFCATRLVIGIRAIDFLTRRTPIELPPGLRLRSLINFVYSRKTVARVFKPVLDDLEVEYLEALKEGSLCKARWVYWRGVGAFWCTVFFHLSASIVVKAYGALRLMIGG